MNCGECPRKLAPLPAGLRVRESRDIAPDELLVLMDACGNEAAALDAGRIEQAIENSPYIVHARSAGGSLVAYLAAFSDSARVVYISDLMVHPGWRNRGLGRRLMQHLEAHFDGVPIVLDADASARPFFEKLGYHARPAVVAMLKQPAPKHSYAADFVTASAGDPVAPVAAVAASAPVVASAATLAAATPAAATAGTPRLFHTEQSSPSSPASSPAQSSSSSHPSTTTPLLAPGNTHDQAADEARSAREGHASNSAGENTDPQSAAPATPAPRASTRAHRNPNHAPRR